MLEQQLPDFVSAEDVIARFDAEEKSRLTGELELRRVEDRMVRLRQAVQPKHAYKTGNRGEEDGELKGDRNERRPAVQRPSPDIERVIDDRGIPLHSVCGQRARDSTEQRDQRHFRAREAE